MKVITSNESLPYDLDKFVGIDNTNINNYNEFYNYSSKDYKSLQDPCRYCSNNPINGGSGICHCILGVKTFYC